VKIVTWSTFGATQDLGWWHGIDSLVERETRIPSQEAQTYLMVYLHHHQGCGWEKFSSESSTLSHLTMELVLPYCFPLLDTSKVVENLACIELNLNCHKQDIMDYIMDTKMKRTY